MGRSLSRSPFIGYTFSGFAFACVLTLGVVGVYLARNGATGMYAVYFAPLYLIAFSMLTEAVVIVWLLARPRLVGHGVNARVTVLATIAALGGVPIAFVFWWCITFQMPPIWAVALAVLASAGAFGWYAARYERSGRGSAWKLV